MQERPISGDEGPSENPFPQEELKVVQKLSSTIAAEQEVLEGIDAIHDKMSISEQSSAEEDDQIEIKSDDILDKIASLEDNKSEIELIEDNAPSEEEINVQISESNIIEEEGLAISESPEKGGLSINETPDKPTTVAHDTPCFTA